jgi:hypothetical protein
MLDQVLSKDQFTLGQEIYVDHYENKSRPRSIYSDNQFEVGYVAKIEDSLIKTTVGDFELPSGIHQADEDSFDFDGEVFLSVEDLMNKRDRLLAFAALKSALENEDSYGSSVREISTDELAEFALKLCFDKGDV